MSYNVSVGLTEQDIRTQQPATQPSGATWSPSLKFGQIGGMNDGRAYTYCLNGAVALAAGYTVQETAIVANHQNRTNATVTAIGSTTVLVPLGATLATVSQYAGGYLTINSGTGKGYTYRVKNNQAAALSTTCTVTLLDPILVALDTTSVFSLTPAPQNGVIVTPTSSPLNVVGVSDIVVTAANYFWAQIQGTSAVFTDSAGTIAANTGIIPSVTVAGAVIPEVAATVTQRLGYNSGIVTIASQASLVVLQITNK